MPRNSSGGVGGMFDDLKSRLGFGRNDDDYDDYDDYDDGEDDYDEYGSSYEEPSSSAYRPARAGSGRTRTNFGDLSSNLVNIDDVKASTRVPDRLQRDPLASTGDSYSSRGSSRDFADVPAYDTSRDSWSRSEGLDSLFEPSDNSAYDPYEAYSSSAAGAYSPIRSLTVIKPVVYGDVERVARAVKSGDVVVLVMRNTPDDLSKRILDFSFGVASALDANVECPGDKVFAIARGNELSAEEKQRLRNQGAL